VDIADGASSSTVCILVKRCQMNQVMKDKTAGAYEYVYVGGHWVQKPVRNSKKPHYTLVIVSTELIQGSCYL
jgi:hypothetical protein